MNKIDSAARWPLLAAGIGLLLAGPPLPAYQVHQDADQTATDPTTEAPAGRRPGDAAKHQHDDQQAPPSDHDHDLTEPPVTHAAGQATPAGHGEPGHEHEQATTGLDPHHPQSGGDDHDPWWHRLQHWLIEGLGGRHPHADEHEHDDHGEPTLLTRYQDDLELFLELPPLVAGEPAELLAHLTRLTDFRPVAEGSLEVSLTPDPSVPTATAGARDQSARSTGPSRPGLFRVRLTPSAAGPYRLRVKLHGDGASSAFDAGPVTIHPDHRSAAAAQDRGDPPGDVILTKEQQWRSELATEVVRRRRLRGSVPATGLLRPSADGEAHVTAPIDGHLRPVAGGAARRFPFTGMRVETGQVIADLVPRLGGESDVAGLELDLTRAESELGLARQERERLDALWKDRSVPYRDVLQARSTEEVSAAELSAARRRLAQVRRTEEGEANGVPVRAPIAGVVARVEVAPGGFVEEGERLFHIVDPGLLWLDARVAEADAGLIQDPTGAWFRVPGFAPHPERVFDVNPRTGARLVAFGAMVDPQSRTVPLIFEFPRPDERLRVGLSVTARVLTGDERETLAVPAGALVNDAGADIVYVQTGGEHFQRRLVQTGLRDGDYVGIRAGLREGERVVSRGAYLVHLAAGAAADPGHGHAH